MVGFIFSVRLLERSPFTIDEIETLRPWVAPALLWSVVICLLALSALYVTDNFENVETDRIAAGSMGSQCFPWTIHNLGKELMVKSIERLLEKIRANRTELAILVMVLGLAFAVRTIDLSNHPYPWSGDEVSIGTEGACIVSGNVTNFFETGWSSQPNWSFVPTAITEIIFGKNIVAVRMASVLAGTLAVLFRVFDGPGTFQSQHSLDGGNFSRDSCHTMFTSVE